MLTATRRRFAALAAVFAIVLGATALGAPGRALAGDGDCASGKWVQVGDQMICQISSPGSPGGGGEGDGVGLDCTNNHITYQGKDYICDLPDGWSFSYGCYIKLMEPQPPAGDPAWGTADPNTTRMQYVSCDTYPPKVPGDRDPVAGPCVGRCGGLNPVQGVTKQLAIKTPDLGMAPPGGAGAVGFVNANVWLWSKGLDTSTQTRQAGTVVGVRTFVRADWTVKKGTATVATLHCTSDNEYTPDKGNAASPDPDCAYQFKTPGDYSVSVTTTWTLLITQNGVAEPLQNVTSAASTTTITIQEGQSTNG
ncbi:MAG: hypothetical protein HOW97_19185 [Catenulispora sp.]|nr:hypothetical protein [Catenulispora sp.]